MNTTNKNIENLIIYKIQPLGALNYCPFHMAFLERKGNKKRVTDGGYTLITLEEVFFHLHIELNKISKVIAPYGLTIENDRIGISTTNQGVNESTEVLRTGLDALWAYILTKQDICTTLT